MCLGRCNAQACHEPAVLLLIFQLPLEFTLYIQYFAEKASPKSVEISNEKSAGLKS